MTERPPGDAGKIFVTHGERLMRLAKRLLGSETDAEDAVQEVMLAILRAPHVLADVERLGAWLFTLVRRRCADIIRQRAGRRRTEGLLWELGKPILSSSTPAERDELAETIARAVRELPDPLQYVFVENVLHGKTYREISKSSGIPAGTLMARKQQAVAKLQKTLRTFRPAG